MRCRNCDYPLWNLKARQCPECGTPFRPSEFKFVPNSVQFCCPDCEQVYYGTQRNGHLRPLEFDCVRCGRRVHMDEMVLRPAAGVEEAQTQVDRMPWLERRRRGVIRAWLAMIGRSMGAPMRLMRSVPPQSSGGEAWGYALLTVGILLLMGLGLPLLVFSGVMALNGDPDAGEAALAAGGVLVGGLAALAVVLGLWGLVTHGLLRITGGCEHSLKRTYQALCYSCGTLVPLGVPCVGFYCGIYFLWIWWVVSAILMVVEGQRVHGGRATLAVITFPVGMIVLGVGLYAAWMYFIFSAMAAGTGPFAAAMAGGGAAFETQLVTNELIAYVQAHGNKGPSHALDLISEGDLFAGMLTSGRWSTAMAEVPVGGTTLDRFQRSGPRRQGELARAAAGSLPRDVVAHRLGDFVFTYHGIDFSSCDGRLWVVIQWPDPEANAGGAAAGEFVVGTADGQVRRIGKQALAGELAAQNALRSAEGLPPLPDPATVTHGKPGRGGEVTWR